MRTTICSQSRLLGDLVPTVQELCLEGTDQPMLKIRHIFWSHLQSHYKCFKVLTFLHRNLKRVVIWWDCGESLLKMAVSVCSLSDWKWPPGTQRHMSLHSALPSVLWDDLETFEIHMISKLIHHSKSVVPHVYVSLDWRITSKAPRLPLPSRETLFPICIGLSGVLCSCPLES